MQGMLSIDNGSLISGKSMLVVLSFAIGTVIGAMAILIFCVGINLVWGKRLRVANMLPAVLLAVLAAYIPWE